jgi:molybdopterin synthase sulfur carrier subunit
MSHTLKVRYFAWVRERIGKPDEDIEVPDTVATVGELMTFLAARGEEYAHAFENPKVIRAAIDKAHVKAQTPLGEATEIAFFPPMTGG